jgi:hypothetical protein
MRIAIGLITAAMAVLFTASSGFANAGSTSDPSQLLAKMGAETIRQVHIDICLPATNDEYEGLGKNAIVMLTSSSAVSSELPLKSAYVEVNGVRVPLQKIATFDKYDTNTSVQEHSNIYTNQVSFYLIPIYLLKTDAKLSVDFAGKRESFGVQTFPEEGEMPSFVRLDEYDNPSDPDMRVVASLLAREYPKFFSKSSH